MRWMPVQQLKTAKVEYNLVIPPSFIAKKLNNNIKKNMNHRKYTWVILLIVIVLLLSVIIIFIERFTITSSKTVDGLIALISSFIGVIVTIAVTALLLNNQFELDSVKEKGIAQFKHKQETYNRFLQQLNLIIVELTERSIKGKDAIPYENITKVEHLFQKLCCLKMHLPQKQFKDVSNSVATILNTYRVTNLRHNFQTEIKETGRHKSDEINKSLYNLMENMSKQFFTITDILNKDLYGTSITNKNQENTYDNEIAQLLESCGLKKEH